MTSAAAGGPARSETGGSGQPAGPASGSAADYRERMFPAPWIWAAGALMAGLVSLVASPFGPAIALVTAVIAVIVIGAVLVVWSPVVAVRGGELVAGRAHVPVGLLGEATVLDAVAMRQELGRGLDVRAFLCIRGWIPSGLRVALHDPDDPTPYWLLSSRRPESLAAALGRVRAEGGNGR
jgi:hypothetical protein